MAQEVYRRIIGLVAQAAELARSIGIPNLLQPGLVKEMIIADALGHTLIASKRDADAHAPGDPNEKYEYLSCVEGGSGQFDRMFKEPAEKRALSLYRITRNAKVYVAVFYASEQMSCKTIYELAPAVVAAEAERQLNVSANAISHVGLSVEWASRNGTVVWQDRSASTAKATNAP